MTASGIPLEHLHDIHLPSPIGAWPWALGWYLLVMLGMLLLIFGVVVGQRWLLQGLAKREALVVLARIEAAYKVTPAHQQTAAAISELLKRVALVYFPRERVADLYGKAWLTFLNDTSARLDFFEQQEALTVGPYVSSYEGPLDALLPMARSWIKQRRKPCLY